MVEGQAIIVDDFFNYFTLKLKNMTRLLQIKKGIVLLLLFPTILFSQTQNLGFTNAASFGFSPDSSGFENTEALQKAVDLGGTIIVSIPGTYKFAGTVYLGSNTTVQFGNGVFIKKVNEKGNYSHVLLNKGAITKTYNEHISVIGLNIIVNKVDTRLFKEAYGLHGQLAFFYVKDLTIKQFRCLDLGTAQYGIQVCTFEDITIDDVIIKGMKDGVHLGRGKRFTIRNGVFQTFDDAIALNAHDWAVGNPEMGWIENGVVENCHDLNAEKTSGYFCRILAGGWKDWTKGMEVQQSDIVVSNGRLYRVQMNADEKKYISNTKPTHETGSMVLDSIRWGMVQNDVTYTAGVRNVTFRDIFLYKPRVGFSIHFDNDKYSRSYYPGAPVPVQEQLVFDNVRVLYDYHTTLFGISTPIDVITITNSSFQFGGINFSGNKAMVDYLPTTININNCAFNKYGEMVLLNNTLANKKIFLKTSASLEKNASFKAKIISNSPYVTVNSDLTGLNGK